MNLLGTIFRSGSIHIWSSNGCFQRRDGVSGSSHTLTVTLADVLLIDFGPRRRCKSTQAGCISNCGSKRNNNGEQSPRIKVGDANDEGVALVVPLKETCGVAPLADQRGEGRDAM